jgi:type I restriction enzyme S subunit
MTGVNLEHAESLRQSVVKRAFEGRLVPRDPSDEPGNILLKQVDDSRVVLRTWANQ